jgi:hypothetical protein
VITLLTYTLLSYIDSIKIYIFNLIFCRLFIGEHPAAMHQEHVGELHQAPPHHTRRLHICWPRVLDTTGIKRTVSRDFPFSFFPKQSPPRALIHGLKPFRTWLRIRRDIRFGSRLFLLEFPFKVKRNQIINPAFMRYTG